MNEILYYPINKYTRKLYINTLLLGPQLAVYKVTGFFNGDIELKEQPKKQVLKPKQPKPNPISGSDPGMLFTSQKGLLHLLV